MAEADEGHLEVTLDVVRRLGAVIALCIPLCVLLASTAVAGQARPAPGPARAARPPRCGDAARAQAAKLLALHVEHDSRVEVAPSATARPSMRNPADATQRLEVVEVWGYVAKGQYRMRFLYIGGYSPCTLVGQEILEYGRF